jgi:drug/metabolite transporter (DMT)-like permease
MVRFGLLRISSPLTGATIAATTSFITMSVLYRLFEEKKPLKESAPTGFKLFAAAGFMNFLSYAFAYTALSMERVSLISPLINGSSLFILPLSALLLKDVENHAAQIAATLLVILGVFLISWESLRYGRRYIKRFVLYRSVENAIDRVRADYQSLRQVRLRTAAPSSR